MIRSATRRWLVTAVFLFTIAALAHAALADERAADNFDGFLEPIRLAHNVPALAALLIHGERIAGIGAVGYRKLG